MTAPRAHATWHHARPAPPRARACPALPAARVPQPFQPHDQPACPARLSVPTCPEPPDLTHRSRSCLVRDTRGHPGF